MRRKPLSKKVKVHFEPDNADIIVEQGANLLEAAIDAGVHISASCGGAGVCGTCKIGGKHQDRKDFPSRV